ncbi:R-linalool synthase [Handroanthus impetiginosus]|uniref:R-linalool synthase n=1 Tax=Handroanthus impetiginosus TaxID=429701 RepID=A0A2G9HTP3_9LAMI|nr:R-linalool synthase [Handroanthus impetiginosus]
MASSRSTITLSSRASYGFSKSLFSWKINSCPMFGSRARTCICMSSSAPTSQSSSQMPIVTGNDALLKYIRQPVLFPSEEDEITKRREYLLEKTRIELQKPAEALEKLKLIDTIQRLGIGYYLEDDINGILQVEFSDGFSGKEDLFTTALRFRLLRHCGFRISSDVFLKFVGKNGKFKESLVKDTLGLLSLYEASYVGAKGEQILEEAMDFTKTHLQQSLPHLPPQLHRQVAQALELPRHLRMARLEARRFIEQYGLQSNHDRALLELATLDYNRVQAQHQMELAEITRSCTILFLH